MKPTRTDRIERIIDANINRAKEGLRVCEEISRFILESRTLTEHFKKIRHKINAVLKNLPKKINLLEQRYSLKDIGLNINLRKEFKRTGFQDILFANMQRVEESLRVLEEFSKLKNINAALQFKKLRYSVYELEKRAAKKINR